MTKVCRRTDNHIGAEIDRAGHGELFQQFADRARDRAARSK